ncbi:O-antigen translocase [Flavobacterium crassostreae]|uniref:Multidrug transporter MatE n=1 Tax=Flavobacterium crassostreae TaxID=1763534 RepID=A0A1B9E0A7_9FLAO|nr:O-antigen translocase [Flavobacterium crassostreae]OCB75370.1 multidrug transporter MatE [Flavobacterium crassostreae]
MKLIKTTLYSGISTVIRIAFGFISSKVIALYTGPAGVALIGTFANLITIVQTFANGAIATGVVKYTAEYDGDKESLKTLFSTALKISIYCSAIMGCFVVLGASMLSALLFASHQYSNPIRILGFSLVFYALNTLAMAILNGQKQIKTYTLIHTIASMVGLLSTLLLVSYFRVEGALYALVFSQVVVFFIAVYLVSKSTWFSVDYFKQRMDPATIKKLAHYSIMAIVSALTLPVSQILLRNKIIATQGLQAAGLWQAMLRISDGYLMVLTTALATYYLPKLASLHTKKELQAEIIQGYKILIPTVALGCLVLYYLRFFIIQILYTPDFVAMSDLFFYQLLGDFFKMCSWILAYMMLAKAMTKWYIFTEISSTLLYLLLGHLGINYFGLKGITMAYACNYFIYFLTMLVLFGSLLFHKTKD